MKKHDQLRAQIASRFPGFQTLGDVLIRALEQAAEGKGRERHGGDDAWADQPIKRIPHMLGEAGLGFLLGQSMKKAAEGAKMVARGQKDEAGREFLGAIVYLASAYEELLDE